MADLGADCCLVKMVKSCGAVDCRRKFKKGSGISVYNFPSDPSRRARWIAAVRRKRWSPNE